MREHLNPLVEIVEGELVLANLALVADGTVAPKLAIFRLLQKPAGLSVFDVGRYVRDSQRVLSHSQAFRGQVLQGHLWEGTVVSPEDVDLDDFAILDIRPLAVRTSPGTSLD